MEQSKASIAYSPFDKSDLEQAVCARFEEQARKHPSRDAIRTRDVTLTYSALNWEANRIARAIVQRYGTEPQQIAYLLTDDAHSAAAMLGILKAGKVFVPLEPRHPHARNRGLVEHANVTSIITDRDGLETARALFVGEEPLNIDAIHSSIPGENLGLAIPPETPACILYTSGSTGQPKGVLHNQRNLLAWGLTYGYSARISAADRLCIAAARTSAQSLVILLNALFSGASACPFRLSDEGPRLLASWLIDEKITIIHCSPSLFRSLVRTLSGKDKFPHLRLLRLGGETVTTHDLQRYKEYFSRDCVFMNSLGATEVGPFREFLANHETSICEDTVPSGYPAWGMDVSLVNDSGQPVEFGCIGEVVVHSDYLAMSYWRQPELTKAVFVPDPTDPRKRVYRTGDLGRLSSDGCLHHLGRKGRQVKIRGNRVELTEIEITLRTIDSVQDAAVTVRQNHRGEPCIVAYVAATEPLPSTISLRTNIRNRLPEYMVPSKFVMVDSIPINSHGKVDYEALPEPTSEREYLPPRNAIETLLCELWEQILGIYPVGIRDDFLELGGNSLLAARLISHIELHFGRRIPRSGLLSVTTVEGLAKLVPERPEEDYRSLLLRIQAGSSSRKPFFFLHGQFNGWGFYCKALAALLGPEQPLFVLSPMTPGDDLPPTVEQMAKRYLSLLREAQPHGPYLLGGYCNGGLIAFEMAQVLRAEGETVELLVLIESQVGNVEFRTHRQLAALAARILDASPAEELEYFFRLCQLSTYFSGLSGWQRTRFLLRKAGELPRFVRWANRQLWQHSRAKDATPAAEDAIAPSDEWGPDRLNHHYSRLVRGYVPRPYQGRVAIFRAKDVQRSTDDPTLGWCSLVRDLDAHTIPGDHHGCIDLAENLCGLADHLQACLDACQPSKDKIPAVAEEVLLD